MQVLVYISV